jgi:hypothetical protein
MRIVVNLVSIVLSVSPRNVSLVPEIFTCRDVNIYFYN